MIYIHEFATAVVAAIVAAIVAAVVAAVVASRCTCRENRATQVPRSLPKRWCSFQVEFFFVAAAPKVG